MLQENNSQSEGTEKQKVSTSEENLTRLLQDKYGITISCNDVTAADMDNLHYRKITGDELSSLNQYLKFIPQIFANETTKNAAESAFKSATEGTYRVRLGNGTHLAHSHQTPGAYRAMEFSDATNKLVGNAELFANDATFTIDKVPQFASGLFDVASMVTGQYFMAQINAKLDSLTSSIEKLEKMFDAQRRGKLRNAAQTLEDLCEKLTNISVEPSMVDEDIQQIHSIQKVAGESLNESDELVKSKIKAMNPKDDEDTVTSTIESIIKDLADYQYATQIFAFATLVEAQIKSIIDPEELVKYRNQICRRVDQYKDASIDAENKIADYINKAKALNEPNKIISTLAELSPSTATSMRNTIGDAISAVSVWAIAEVSKYIERKENKCHADKKAKIAKQFQMDFSRLKDPTLLDSPVSTIDLFISTAEFEKEYIMIGNDYYINLPSS